MSSTAPQSVTSADGTRIAYDVYGPAGAEPLIVVGGALNHRSSSHIVRLVTLLSERFRVVSYDRRGRGGSTDVQPFAPEREVDDLLAVIDAVGGAAHVYGLSSGAALALSTAATHPGAVRSLALYEAPFLVDGNGLALTPEAVARVQSLVDADRRSEVVKEFMRQVEVPGFVIRLMPLMPMWRALKALAHTVPYDFAQLGDHRSGRPYPAGAWSAVTMPTLVVSGGKSPAGMQAAMVALAAHLPAARHHDLPGQTHIVKPAALAPVLLDFFAAQPLAGPPTSRLSAGADDA